MKEQDYIELDVLLAKLRVICLKNLSQNGNYSENENITKLIRKENEKALRIIRNIDYIRTNMPLQVEDSIIEIK